METYELIKKIKSMEQDDFEQWFRQMILVNSNESIEEQLFNKIITNSSENKLYRLLRHIDNYDTNEQENTYAYNDLISLVMEEKDYFINKTKNYIIKKMASYSKLYLIKFRLFNEDYKLVVQEIEKEYHGKELYEYEKCEHIIVDITKYKFKIIKSIVKTKKYEDLLEQDQVFNLEYSDYSQCYYGIEFDKIGMVNNIFSEAVDIELTELE